MSLTERRGQGAGPRYRPGPHPGSGLLPGRASPWWLVVVAAAFTAALLLSVPPALGLAWDESVYVSQVSAHAPAAYFDPARARGITLLAAPVTLLTSSVVALRVYLSVAAGAGLLAALWAWRPLRPAWVLALAGLAFGGLWVTQFYAAQVMPDVWSALAGLAAVGCFLRFATGHDRRGALAGLAASLAGMTLLRPGDAAYLGVPLAAAVLAVRAWRRWPLLAATVAGLVAGAAEWVVEAEERFGGLAARLHAAGLEQGGFGLHFALPDELRALNGPTLCRPCTVGVRYPELDLWWFALPVLAAAGVLAARRAGQLGSSLLPAVCGLCVAAQYIVMIGYAAPRFLLPAYALLAIPVADALAWLVTGVRQDLRPAMAVAVGACLAAQLVVQHAVLAHEVGGTARFHDDYARIVAGLRALGIRPPCLVNGDQDIPIAFDAGCASAGSVARAAAYGSAGGTPPGGGAGTRDEHLALLVPAGHRPPGYARRWHVHALPGTKILKLAAYLPPHRPAPPGR
ncbi:MAG TPA: hypothetical protein VKV80_00700 [Streptosporangiaceae bacterium]|nr:hypothetical protein [Streptosporangiaceae bacterium]